MVLDHPQFLGGSTPTTKRPFRPRTAFILHEVEGFSTQEICKIWEVSRIHLSGGLLCVVCSEKTVSLSPPLKCSGSSLPRPLNISPNCPLFCAIRSTAATKSLGGKENLFSSSLDFLVGTGQWWSWRSGSTVSAIVPTSQVSIGTLTVPIGRVSGCAGGSTTSLKRPASP